MGLRRNYWLRLAIILGLGCFVWFMLIEKIDYRVASPDYMIEKLSQNFILEEDGSLRVSERLTYRIKQPFREIFRTIPYDEKTLYKNIEVKVEGVTPTLISAPENIRALNILVAFSDSALIIPPEDGIVIVLDISYTVEGLMEAGLDIAQIHLCESWDIPVRNIEAKFGFPLYFPLKSYFHPMTVKPVDDGFCLYLDKLNTGDPVEARFLFPLEYLDFMDENLISQADISRINIYTREESLTSKETLWGKLLPYFLIVLTISIFVAGFFFLGREPETGYDLLYEREPPTRDRPELINAVVKNLCGGVDGDGFTAVALSLYRRGIIEMNKNPSGKRVTSLTIKEGNYDDLPNSERTLLFLLKKYSVCNIFDFQMLKGKLLCSEKEARAFNAEAQAWKTFAMDEIYRNRYMDLRGYQLIKSYSVFLLIFSAVFKFFPIALTWGIPTYLPLAFWITGLVAFSLPRDIFGRWSPEGRLYYQRWQAFGAFLEDYSLISEAPPASTEIWEDYLIYATALGIANKVTRKMQGVIPQIVDPSKRYVNYLDIDIAIGLSNSFRMLISPVRSHRRW